jgi:DNA processing protein
MEVLVSDKEIKELKVGNCLFPKQLLKCSSFPQTLYVRGDAGILSEDCIAVIGQRDASERYNKIAYKVGSILAKNGYVVLNGLAIGCDKNAILGALSQGGKVVAVLPCGLDSIYPASCKEIAEDIIDKGGCLVSQYPVGVMPEKYRFVERDKLQAKLSNKVIVISAKKSGGTMHTVSFAVKEGRKIGCFLERDISSPEGNSFIYEKFNSCRITDNDTLLNFMSLKDEKQLSIFDIT